MGTKGVARFRLVVPIPFSELLGRFQTAVNPVRVGVLDHHLMEVIALGTFKSPQIGSVRAWLDPSQHRALLTFRATWPFVRK
jgi:hypothetical protein